MHRNIGPHALDGTFNTRTLEVLSPHPHETLPRPRNAHMLAVGESVQVGRDGGCGERLLALVLRGGVGWCEGWERCGAGRWGCKAREGGEE